MDVFISWTQADKDVKNVIAKKLQDAGISYWDSEQRCTSDYAAECTAAIKQCRVFLAIVSDASMAKGSFVQNEITAARTLEGLGKLNILVYKITDNPYTDAFEFLLNHISFVSGNLVKRHAVSGGESGIDTIVKRAKSLLDSRRNGNPEKPFDVHCPEIDGLHLTKNSYFVEGSRDNVIEAIENGFRTNNILILSEFIGYGKRSVIKAFAEQHKNDFTTVVMVDNPGAGLRDFFLSGLHFVNLNDRLFESLEEEANLKEKFKFLSRLNEKNLLVIPNVKLETNPDTAICQMLTELKCRVVILTQSDADAYEDIFPVIRVGRMQDEYLYQLFFHHYSYTSEEEQEQLKKPLARFFDSIGGHTKTVELTASALNRELRVPPDEIPNYLSMQGNDGLQMKERIIRQIENIFSVEVLSKDAITTLLVASCIAVPYISEKHFYKVLKQCGVENREIVSQLDDHRWLDLDTRNRTVSIEPLVAQVVFSRVPDPFEIAVICFDYLISVCNTALGLSVSKVAFFRNLHKISHFLYLAGFDVCGQLVEAYIFDKNIGDGDAVQQALRRFEECYSNVAVIDDEDGEVDEFVQSEYQLLEETILDFVRPLVPVLKLSASGHDKLLLDYSIGSNQLFKDVLVEHYSFVENLLGLTKIEFEQILDAFRTEVELLQQKDSESLEALIMMEGYALLDGFMSRNFTVITISVERFVRYICDNPEILCGEDFSQFIFTILQLIANWFLSSGSFSLAIIFCEKILSLPMNDSQRLMFVKIYILTLRNSAILSDELFRAYKEFIKGYDCAALDAFDNRDDAIAEKKHFVLMYAIDLAKTGRAEEAAEQFAVAQKMTAHFMPDEEVDCANQVVKAFTNAGEFVQAVNFIKNYFQQIFIGKYLQKGNEETKNILADFELYRTAANEEIDNFTDDANPKKYINYYQSFSRKNNGLLERKYLSVADDALNYDFSYLNDDEIAVYAEKLRQQTRRKKPLQMAPEAFALVSEAGYRVLGYRHHYVQFMGAAAMADGKIAEILNGEGKTYTIVLTAFLQHLFGNQVFVVDESPFLTERNYTWMRGVYELLGVPVFYVKDSRQIPVEQNSMYTEANVTYVDLNSLVLGYLTNEIKYSKNKNKLCLNCVIIDEIDTTLVDKAQTPFCCARIKKGDDKIRLYKTAWNLVQALSDNEEYYVCDNGCVNLKPTIYPLVEKIFHVSYKDVSNIERIQQIEETLRIAFLCCYIYEKDQDYFIHNNIPVLEDKEKGVFKSFNPVYDYFLCKENDLDTKRVEKNLSYQSSYLNYIVIRDFFSKFKTVCGTTATAVSFKKEFKEIYGLDYVSVPPHSPCIRNENLSPVYISHREKIKAILSLVQEKKEKEQPILLITQSVAESEEFSRYLKRCNIEHVLLNAKNAYAFSDLLARAGVPGSVLVTNALAGRGADIKLGGDPEIITRQELVEQGEDVSLLNTFVYSVATPAQKETSLYKKYYSILEKNKRLCSADRQKVIEAGGLCVIGTAFFPEPRTEQQTIGRCARQGNVGESWLFRSLEDKSLREFLSQATMAMAVLEKSIADSDVDSLASSLLSKAICNAQQRLHTNRFADIRKHNDNLYYIEAARADFVGKSHDLVDGKISVDVILNDWARDMAVLKDLQALQKGEHIDNKALLLLWKSNPKLQEAKGFNTSKILFAVAQGTLKERYDDLSIEEFVSTLFIKAWNEYIDTVLLAQKHIVLQDSKTKKYLADKKEKLLREPMEQLLIASLRNIGF